METSRRFIGSFEDDDPAVVEVKLDSERPPLQLEAGPGPSSGQGYDYPRLLTWRERLATGGAADREQGRLLLAHGVQLAPAPAQLFSFTSPHQHAPGLGGPDNLLKVVAMGCAALALVSTVLLVAALARPVHSPLERAAAEGGGGSTSSSNSSSDTYFFVLGDWGRAGQYNQSEVSKWTTRQLVFECFAQCLNLLRASALPTLALCPPARLPSE